jgi:hypothetical protein
MYEDLIVKSTWNPQTFDYAIVGTFTDVHGTDYLLKAEQFNIHQRRLRAQRLSLFLFLIACTFVDGKIKSTFAELSAALRTSPGG